ncbi:insecticidal delta-endotoxin Cry8Ea1 family protein [Bacillus pseudomycoides]|uniref:insecticidal delta-endotoxin Cry8Ea1 family protein n=1 Tax=Bacillus pseudomycoides TaxID=64104 RepID=UPI0015CF5A46|nr:insecticidal delta-endotoxin Cry8Ea1 family protein [Bacillus pseudomycoides]
MSSNTMVPYNVLRDMDIPTISGTRWNKEMFINALDNTSSLLTLIEKGINDGNDVLGLLSFIGLTALEAIPIVGGVLSSLVSIIFFPKKQSIDFKKIWEELEKAIEQIVDRKIEESLMSQLMQEISGFANVLEEYRDAYDLYNGNKFFDLPDKLTPGEYLVNVFTTANLLFIQRIPTFQNPKYDVVFLPFFVHVAEMHILLVRDAAIYGLEWGMDETLHQKFKKDLKDLIDKYTDYLLNTYKKGLKEASERELNDKDFPTTNNKDHYINTVRWNVINQYKRGMTLTVFDFAHKWKYYQEIYQNNITLNPFRTIYSDIAGSVYPYEKTTNEIDNIIKDQNLKYRGIFKRMQVNHAERIDSLQSTYIRNNEIIDSERTGGSGGRASILNLESPINNPLIQVNMWSELVPISLGFKLYDGKEQKIGGGSWWPNPHKFGAYHYVGNKVSSIIGFAKNETGGFNSLDAMVIGFKRDDYTPENRFVGVSKNDEPITKVIDVGNYHQGKFETNITMIDEPMFGDGVLQFENYSNNLNQESYVTYQIHTEIEGTYELHAIIGAKKQKDKISFKVTLNDKQIENFITDSFDDGDVWDGMSLNDGFVYKRILIGNFQLKKGMNSITIHTDVLQDSANIKIWNLAALELTITADSLTDPDITTLYDKDNYTGAKKFIVENTSRLTEFNDKTSSVKVSSNVSGVRLYEHYDYGGNFIDLIGGEKISLKNHPLNNRASSAKFANIVLYNQDNYEGSRKLVFEDVPELTDFNDKTSSITVSSNVLGARLYEHAHYKGSYVDVMGGQKVSLKKHKLNKKLSSIKFFEDDDKILNGVYQVVTGINNTSVIMWKTTETFARLWENNNSIYQQWKVEYDHGKQAYQIKSMADESIVLTYEHDFAWGILCNPDKGNSNQYWNFEYVGEGYYLIRNKKYPEMVFDVNNGDPNNNSIIKVNKQHDLNSPNIAAQKFRFNHINN